MNAIKLYSLTIGLLLCLAVENITAQHLYHAPDVEMTFFSEARFEDIEATSKKGASVLNLITRKMAFKVSIASFTFEKGLMQEHFNENYMESDQYPYANFTGEIVDDIDLTKEGTYKVVVSGELSIHGVVKKRQIEGAITVKKGRIMIDSSFLVPVSDHDIDIPNDKISNISQDIMVKIKAIYEPKD